MKTIRLFTLLAAFTLLTIGCVDNTATTPPNQNVDPNSDWVDNGEGTGNYITEFVISTTDLTQRYVQKITPTPFVGNSFNDVNYEQINGKYQTKVTSGTHLSPEIPQAKETNHYDHSYYEGVSFIDDGGRFSITSKKLMRPYDNAPYKTTWKDGTVTYSTTPYSFVNYKYEATQDWMYGISETGFNADDYTDLVNTDTRSAYLGLEYTTNNTVNDTNLPQGTYTFVYLPSTANDHNDLIYDTKATTPTQAELNDLYGSQEYKIMKSNSSNHYIVLPIIAGTPDNPAQPPQNEDTDIQTNVPEDNDGVPTDE